MAVIANSSARELMLIEAQTAARERMTEQLGTLVVCNPYQQRTSLAPIDRAELFDAATECCHGRLPRDSSPACGCWHE